MTDIKALHTDQPGVTAIHGRYIDAVRRCMLRGSITVEIDSIVTASPVNRCMIIAKALHVSAGQSADMLQIVNSSGIMDGLRQEALLRKNNDASPILLAPLYAAPEIRSQKERSYV